MTTYKYKPYYSYAGPTRSDPFREQLSKEDADKNILWFFEHIDGCFVGTDAVVVCSEDGVVAITTSISEYECDEIVKRHLNVVDLFATKER